jgi:hypothetical protein
VDQAGHGHDRLEGQKSSTFVEDVKKANLVVPFEAQIAATTAASGCRPSSAARLRWLRSTPTRSATSIACSQDAGDVEAPRNGNANVPF